MAHSEGPLLMAAITTYATLQTSLADWAERSDYDFDEILGLAEAEFRIYLGPHFSKESTATLAVVSGIATLPTGLVRLLSLVHDTYGEMMEASTGAIREQLSWDSSGIPRKYAIQGTSIITAAAYTGNLTIDAEGSLLGLTSVNTTNWLITYAPQAYLAMCKSFVYAWMEDLSNASTWRSAALGTLADLGIQSVVMQYGRASLRVRGATP
jgi:hypothetical protein